MKVSITMPDGTTWNEVPVNEAIKAVIDGQTAMVKWERQILVKKDLWCELNINHIQRRNPELHKSAK